MDSSNIENSINKFQQDFQRNLSSSKSKLTTAYWDDPVCDSFKQELDKLTGTFASFSSQLNSFCSSLSSLSSVDTESLKSELESLEFELDSD